MSRSHLAVMPLVNEVTEYPDGTTDDCVMSEWFGENHLPEIVGSNTTVGTLYPDMPSWMSRKPAVHTRLFPRKDLGQ